MRWLKSVLYALLVAIAVAVAYSLFVVFREEPANSNIGIDPVEKSVPVLDVSENATEPKTDSADEVSLEMSDEARRRTELDKEWARRVKAKKDAKKAVQTKAMKEERKIEVLEEQIIEISPRVNLPRP